MWFAKNKIRKRNLYFRNIMALSVPHMWKKAYSLYVFVWFSLNQGMLFWLAADRGGAMLVLSGAFLLSVERKPGLSLCPPSPFSVRLWVPFNIYTKLSLIVMASGWNLEQSPVVSFPVHLVPKEKTPRTQYFFWHHTEILQLLSSTDIWFSKK